MKRRRKQKKTCLLCGREIKDPGPKASFFLCWSCVNDNKFEEFWKKIQQIKEERKRKYGHKRRKEVVI